MGLDMAEAAFWDIWINSASVNAFETGRLDTPEFCRRIAGELGQSETDGFEARLKAWKLMLYPGVEEMVHAIPRSVSVALLSNTNEIHWGQVASTDSTFARFDRLFLSYETGHYKPMRAAFEQVSAHFRCNPTDVLFLDDSEHNVAAAKGVGFDAHRTRGISEVRAVIDRCVIA